MMYDYIYPRIVREAGVCVVVVHGINPRPREGQPTAYNYLKTISPQESFVKVLVSLVGRPSQRMGHRKPLECESDGFTSSGDQRQGPSLGSPDRVGGPGSGVCQSRPLQQLGSKGTVKAAMHPSAKQDGAVR